MDQLSRKVRNSNIKSTNCSAGLDSAMKSSFEISHLLGDESLLRLCRHKKSVTQSTLHVCVCVFDAF